MKHNTKLTTLNLYNNNIDVDGLSALATALQGNTTLTEFVFYSDSGEDLSVSLDAIHSIYQRNRDREMLVQNGMLGFDLLAPDLPPELANLIAQQMLIAEDDAKTLRDGLL